MKHTPNLPAAALHGPIGVPALPNVTRILLRYDRSQIESFVAIAIDLLDTIDGDADIEDDDAGEEDDHCGGWADEDHPGYMQCQPEGAGCEISDPGGCEHDGREIENGV